MGLGAEIGSSILLFFLVFGMSATVELKQLRKQLNNRTALLIGLSLQFLILPFFGFVVVKLLQLPAVMGITLLVVTSSPGGSYSNWWCSLFNADLALSVTMTAISTLVSTVMLPVNLILYTRWTYSSAVVKSLDWSALIVSLVVVIGGITCGLVFSARVKRYNNTAQLHRRANLLGNFAGIALITLSITVSSLDNAGGAALWDQTARFYIGVALPAFIGLGIATYLATRFDLEKPERVAVAVESCYQNTGIATSVAITMFSGNEDDLATAIGVPLYYGIVEAVMLACFCLVCWKIGWTKAPKDENLCVVLYNSYEVEEQDIAEQEVAIEVVLGSSDSKEAPNDLIFEQADDGAFIVDEESLDKVKNQDKQRELSRAKPGPLESESVSLDGEPTEHSDHSGDSSVRRRKPHYDEALTESPTAAGSKKVIEQTAEDPSTQSEGSFSRTSRTIAVLRARATGYRQPPQNGITCSQDPRIRSAIDGSEQFEPPSESSESSSDYQSVALQCSHSHEESPVPSEGKTLD